MEANYGLSDQTTFSTPPRRLDSKETQLEPNQVIASTIIAVHTESHCERCQNFRDLQTERFSYAAKVLARSLPEEVISVDGALGDVDVTLNFVDLRLQIKYDPDQDAALSCTLQSDQLSRRRLDGLRAELRKIPVAKRYGNMLDIVVQILALAEELSSLIRSMRAELAELQQKQLSHSKMPSSLEERQVYHPDFNLASIHDVISDLMGIKPQSIVESIAKILTQESLYFNVSRIVHCEVVMRTDLSHRFLERRNDLRAQLQKVPLGNLKQHVPNAHRRKAGGEEQQKAEVIDYLTKPKLTFHGTTAHTVGSIVRYGFLKPGEPHPRTGVPLPVRCGNTYGRGIYSSPNPAFSIMYSGMEATETKPSEIPGVKLLVCATLMGRAATMTREDNWREQFEPYRGSDSHVANNQNEYIVFDSAQILPCYVIHLDWGKDTEAMLQEVQREAQQASSQGRGDKSGVRNTPRRVEANMLPGDRQRLKQERLAQARKFFAYGFGPVTGDRIVIEDIADVDDDEENYGDYQADRLDVSEQSVGFWDAGEGLQGQTVMDQYGVERSAKRKN